MLRKFKASSEIQASKQASERQFVLAAETQSAAEAARIRSQSDR